jgi:3-hydroxybutyryl-CoA dehydrogenase
MEGVGTLEDIDVTMRLGFGFPLGPFEIADKAGLDTIVRWLDNLYKEFGDLKYKASPMLKKKVRANQLGRETGRGFYKYDEDGSKIINKSK